MINVTKTYLPSKVKYQKYVDKIYANGWVTNNGPLVQELEKRLAEYLGVKNIVLVANGTAALEIAYRTLGLEGLCCHYAIFFCGDNELTCYQWLEAHLCRYRSADTQYRSREDRRTDHIRILPLS